MVEDDLMDDLIDKKNRDEVAKQLRDIAPESSESDVVQFMNDMFEQGNIRASGENIEFSPKGIQQIEDDIQDPTKQLDFFIKQAQSSDDPYELFGTVAVFNKRFDINILRTIYRINPLMKLAYREFALPDSMSEADLKIFDPENIPSDQDERGSWPSPEEIAPGDSDKAPEEPQVGDESDEIPPQEDIPEEMEQFVVASIIKQVSRNPVINSDINKALASISESIAEKADINMFELFNKHYDMANDVAEWEVPRFNDDHIRSLDKIIQQR